MGRNAVGYEPDAQIQWRISRIRSTPAVEISDVDAEQLAARGKALWRTNKPEYESGNPSRDAGIARYAKRHDRLQRTHQPVEQDLRKQAAPPCNP
jgi:hypothetical protein